MNKPTIWSSLAERIDRMHWSATLDDDTVTILAGPLPDPTTHLPKAMLSEEEWERLGESLQAISIRAARGSPMMDAPPKAGWRVNPPKGLARRSKPGSVV